MDFHGVQKYLDQCHRSNDPPNQYGEVCITWTDAYTGQQVAFGYTDGNISEVVYGHSKVYTGEAANDLLDLGLEAEEEEPDELPVQITSDYSNHPTTSPVHYR